ncbi:MAG: TadE family type IV pilus minor pilin [Actinoallomurus sp.]
MSERAPARVWWALGFDPVRLAAWMALDLARAPDLVWVPTLVRARASVRGLARVRVLALALGVVPVLLLAAARVLAPVPGRVLGRPSVLAPLCVLALAAVLVPALVSAPGSYLCPARVRDLVLARASARVFVHALVPAMASALVLVPALVLVLCLVSVPALVSVLCLVSVPALVSVLCLRSVLALPSVPALASAASARARELALVWRVLSGIRCSWRARLSWSRRWGERGLVTAETAVAFPALVVVLAVALWGVSAAAAEVACVDAARAGARAAARGEPETAVRAAVLQAAPPNAHVVLSRDPAITRVVVQAEVRPPLKALFPALRLHAQAVAATEPKGSDVPMR